MNSTPIYDAIDRACHRQLGWNLTDSLWLYPAETAVIVQGILDAALPGRTVQ